MKKFLKRFLLVSLVLIILTCVPALVHAGPGDPECDPLDPGCPIDGGMVILLLAGIAYGFKKAWNARRHNIAVNP